MNSDVFENWFNEVFKEYSKMSSKECYKNTSDVNIKNEGEKTVITMDLPGYKKENIFIEAIPERLSISYKGVRGDKIVNFKLLDKADYKKIMSIFEDGVLTVEIPFKESSKPVKIDVR